MISFFGPQAEGLRTALPAELEAVVFDESIISEAARDVLRRRETGTPFYGFAVIDDLRVQLANQVAVEIDRTFADRGQRQAALRALRAGELAINGTPLMKLWDWEAVEGRRTKAAYALLMCDELLVRSFFEYRQYTSLPRFHSKGYRRILLADTLPAFDGGTPGADSVVVWPGRRGAAVATLALMGLEAASSTVTYVGGAPLPNASGRFVARDDAGLAEMLCGTGCVVCVDPADPADAVAFARRGLAVVAPVTSGAYEFSDRIVSWDAADGCALPEAVATALARSRTPSQRTRAVSYYGPRAEAMRAVVPRDVDAVVFDESGLAEAEWEAARRRQRGEHFYAMPVVDDVRIRMCTDYGAVINAQVTHPEQRFYGCQNLAAGAVGPAGGTLADAWSAQSVARSRQIARVLAHADGVLVLSATAFQELRRTAAVSERAFCRRIEPAGTVPPFERRLPARPSLVVWSGKRDTADATLALVGLEEFRGDVSYVGDAPLPNVRARFISRDDPALADTLAVAGCVVCIDPADPSDAVAFARRGMPVVAPWTSGAYEFVDGIVSWDAGDASRLALAAGFALGRVSTGTSADAVALRPPVTPLPLEREHLPLVTVLTATYNRRDFLRRMLTCVAAQTYPCIESVVVNDAGEPVDDIVAEFPFARLVNLDVNAGTYFAASQHGLAAARGEYVAMLPDDDWFYPDHVERLMAAILRSGTAAAHSFAVLRFLRTEPDGTDVTIAANPMPYAESITATPALVGTPVGMSQVLQRRDTFDPTDVGWPIPDAIGSDQEYHMRFTARHQFAAVNHYTCEFRDHPGGGGKTNNFADAMEYIYTVAHPLEDMPLTEELRRHSVAMMRKVPVGEIPYQPTIVFRTE